MKPPHVIVVGGGLAGLSAAIDCLDAGLRVTLLESRPWLGGATWSTTRDGLVVDNGQHVFLRCCKAYRAFLRRLGVENCVRLQPRLSVPVRAPGGRQAWLRRTALPKPLHMAPSLLRFEHVSMLERLRIARTMHRISTLDLDDHTIDDISCGEWLAAQGETDRTLDRFWDLLIRATLNVPVRTASLWLATKVFQTGLLSTPAAGDLGWSRVPLAELHAAPARRLLEAGGAEVAMRCRVQRIVPHAGAGFCVRAGDRTHIGDAVVLATPHDVTAKLLPTTAGVDPRHLEALQGSPIVNLHLWLDRRVVDDPVVAGVDTPLQWMFDRTEDTGLSQGQYLVVSLSAAVHLAPLSTSELRQRCLRELGTLFPAQHSAHVVRFLVTREPRATFLQRPGTLHLRPGSRTRLRGFYLAGAWTDTGWPATMESAVRSGRAAARAVLEDLESRPSRVRAA
jgi:hydroxysqualene dehydroxylase